MSDWIDRRPGWLSDIRRNRAEDGPGAATAPTRDADGPPLTPAPRGPLAPALVARGEHGTLPPGMVYAFATAQRCPECRTVGRVKSTRPKEGYRWWRCPACKTTWKEMGRAV